MHSHISSNLTHREFFRLYGWLPEHRIEALLDIADRVDLVDQVVPRVEEAMPQFCDEGFIDPVREWVLRTLPKHYVEALDPLLIELETEVVQASEYGREELTKALEALRSW